MYIFDLFTYQIFTNMKNQYLIFLLSLLLLVGCTESTEIIPEIDQEGEQNEQPQEPEEEIKNEKYFQLEINENLITEIQDNLIVDNWIFISTLTGEVLDYKPFESGDIIEFEKLSTEIPDFFNITLLSSFRDIVQDNSTYRLITYSKINKGSKWYLKPEEDTDALSLSRGGKLEDVILFVNNVPPSDISGFNPQITFDISDTYGLTGESNQPLVTNIENDLYTLAINYDLYENSRESLVVVKDNNQNSKYAFISNSQADKEITLDYNSFKEFDNFLGFTLPTNTRFYFSRIQAFENIEDFSFSGGYFLNDSFSQNLTKNPIPLVYLDQFENYLTSILVSTNDNYDYSYTKYGSKPEEILFPESIPSISINDKSIANFNFSTESNFKRHTSTWRFRSNNFSNSISERKSTDWNIHSQNSDPIVIFDLPEEIKELYTDINIENLNHSGTSLHINFDDYQEFISKRFASPVIDYSSFSQESFIFK